MAKMNAQNLPVYLQQVQTTKRKMRSPRHQFNLYTKPWQIQPFMTAPVLPGETLQNLLLQSRVVTDPINQPLVGWWKEYYFFYVKHRDLQSVYSEFYQSMALSVDPSAAGVVEAADGKYYHLADSINVARIATYVVVQHWFRDQGELPETYLIDGMYAASTVSGSGYPSALDSLMLDASVPSTDIPETGDMTDLNKAELVWQFMRQQGLTKLDYEDYLRTFGVSAGQAAEAVNKPELIRYVREWSYPVNTVEPTTGVPTSAVSWSISERADKDRFFREPGWIVGLTVTRPKVYLFNQLGNVADWMMSTFDWLPAVAQEDYTASVKQFAEATGPLPGITSGTGGYWIDIRDLFMHGDQFMNHFNSNTNQIALPDANGLLRFPSLTMAESFFSGTPKNIREDGVCQLHILGRQADMT